jgi:hypothetical protein
MHLRIYNTLVVVLQSFIDEVGDDILDENETSTKNISSIGNCSISLTYLTLFPAPLPDLLFTRGKK